MTSPRGLGMLPRVVIRSTAALLLVLTCGGCSSGTETGNPSVNGTLSYTGYSSAPERFGVRSKASVASVESAWFALDKVRVSTDGACGSEAGSPFDVAGLGVGDHAAGDHNRSAFKAERGTFCNVELPFLSVSANDDRRGLPERLLGHAILMEGELADGVRFSIQSDATPQVQLQALSGGFSLSSEQANALIAFDFAAWLAEVDFTAAELDETGAIIISSEANPQLLAKFDAALASGVALYRDRDADGTLDSDPELLAGPR